MRGKTQVPSSKESLLPVTQRQVYIAQLFLDEKIGRARPSLWVLNFLLCAFTTHGDRIHF